MSEIVILYFILFYLAYYICTCCK